jgi:hypothetical protein
MLEKTEGAIKNMDKPEKLATLALGHKTQDEDKRNEKHNKEN